TIDGIDDELSRVRYACYRKMRRGDNPGVTCTLLMTGRVTMRWQRLFLGIGLGLCLTGGQILAEDGITPTSGIFRRYQENCPPALMAPPLGQAIPVPATAPAP